ncbi:MAG: hypothetical protein ILA15_05990 [Clostridiales bacterium]|nr:hypothetical protein [Clostridiales bacterium]
MRAYLYRLLITVKRRPIADILAVVGIFSAIITVAKLDSITINLIPREQETILGIMSLMLLLCFDYAFVTGFRSGVLGYHPADMTFQFAAPFTRVFNLFVSFPYGVGSLVVFVWLLCVNSPILKWWIGFTTADMTAFVIEAFFIMSVTFMLTSFISGRFADKIMPKVIAVVALLLANAVFIVAAIVKLIGRFGSFEAVREQSLVVTLSYAGNLLWSDAFPVAGWVGLIYKGILRGTYTGFPVVIALYAALWVLVVILYRRGKFDFYETAVLNTGRILEIVEASKAGVEAVNTGISRTAVVGKEIYKRGWGSSAFFHMHLFENLRTSKLFFINKVALIYRVFALIVLLITDSLMPEDLDVLVIIVGMTTMMVLNAIVFGGGKTVMEFGRPYFFMVPEKTISKLAMCILADLPEMVFDAVVCTLLIKLVAWNDFTLLPMLALVIMMTAFDLLSQTVGIVCVKVLRQFGKFPMMFARYVLILALLIIGMVPADLVTNGLTPYIADSLSQVLAVMIGMLAITYLIMWGIIIAATRRLFTES